ncbi:MAG: hypothetical protein GY797_38745 [Deltaproteobacteria bacterium]|nr:hypothetical protein [Deltaproteobacteria bacterium]
MPKRKVQIISMTYSVKVTEAIIKKISHADLYNNYSLQKRLENMYGIKKVEYPRVNGKYDTIEITIKTGSVKKVDPNHNNVLWQKIAHVINNHLKEVK